MPGKSRKRWPADRYTAPMTAAQRPPPPSNRRAWQDRPSRDYALFVMLVGPNVALLLLFIYRPLADNIRLSFFDWNISDPTAQFVGLSNYAEWFTRSDTRQIVLNTVVFTAAAADSVTVTVSETVPSSSLMLIFCVEETSASILLVCAALKPVASTCRV